VAFEIEYFHARVLAEVESWPVDVVADYAHLLELLAEHGPNLRLPRSRALGDGLFELRPRGSVGIGRAFYC
jgi:phage-related protein